MYSIWDERRFSPPTRPFLGRPKKLSKPYHMLERYVRRNFVICPDERVSKIFTFQGLANSKSLYNKQQIHLAKGWQGGIQK